MTPLEELQRMRNEFLAMVSHELRGPLTTIKGTAATVLSTSMSFSPLETRQFFRIIDEQVDQLSELVSNLLDVTKIEAGGLVVTPRGTTVADLVDEAIRTFLRAGSRNYVDADLAPELPAVAADPLRITQVLSNLLSNASKYSPVGSAISVSAVLKEPYLAISVVDQGQGIAADQLPHLFKKFSRVDSTEAQTEGHGLGLAICKGIVEAHGGRIWAESRGRGHGTRFTFTLPIAPAEADGDAERSTPIAVTELTRILSVDDDPQALRYIRNVLTDAGYHPIVTGNPNEVMHLFEIEKPHLVLLDVRMPGMDGFQLMKQLGEVSWAAMTAPVTRADSIRTNAANPITFFIFPVLLSWEILIPRCFPPVWGRPNPDSGSRSRGSRPATATRSCGVPWRWSRSRRLRTAAVFPWYFETVICAVLEEL